MSKTGGRGGPTEAAAREAVQAAFKHAAALNAHALVAGKGGGLLRDRVLQGSLLGPCVGWSWDSVLQGFFGVLCWVVLGLRRY